MNSYNHYAYGTVMDWVYTVAGGVKTMKEAPGFERAVIVPVPAVIIIEGVERQVEPGRFVFFGKC